MVLLTVLVLIVGLVAMLDFVGLAVRYYRRGYTPRQEDAGVDIQAMIDGMAARAQTTRAQTQLTLGQLIAALSQLPADLLMANLRNPHSYRGYYCDLAFERAEGTRLAGDLLAECRAAMGEVFEGYKGGDFVMGRNTPLWVSSYGTASGQRLMAVAPDGSLVIAPEPA